jgi:hypothetical protein
MNDALDYVFSCGNFIISKKFIETKVVSKNILQGLIFNGNIHV